ncbi:MAG: putative bifunctional diguanylate cyclase/phosphodiesterase [Gemmatimonadaceae bacterium]
MSTPSPRGGKGRGMDDTLGLHDKRFKRDVWLVAVFAACIFAVAAVADPFDPLIRWARRHESLRVEAWLTVLMVLPIAVAVFAHRRRREVVEALRQSRRSEERHRASDARANTLLQLSPNPIILLCADSNTILDGNLAFETLSGHRISEVRGRTESELELWDNAAGDWTEHRSRLGSGGVNNVERLLRTGAGDTVPVLYSADFLTIDGVRALLVTLTDYSERKRLERELAHQAFHDSLTGLANRALFSDRVAHTLSSAIRRRGRAAVLFLDVDDFKRVNDSLGHAAGDALLREMARRISHTARESDTSARFGGDEFAILVDEVTDANDALRLADRVLAATRAPVMIDGGEVSMSVSVGIAFSEPGQSAEELLRNADIAMYLAKAKGKGRHAVFEAAMHDAVASRLQLERDLQLALTRNEFELYYQPVVGVRDHRVVGFEALLRWNHPTRGLLAPGEFISLAEQTGLICDIGRWVVMTACRQAMGWRSDRPDHAAVTIAVNVSVKQLERDDVIDEVRAALAASGLTPAHLTLEITESMLAHHDSRIAERLWQLKGLGVRIAVDDFGTGYSSLAYLQRFPIDVIKIDRSFTERLSLGDGEPALSRAVVTLGRMLAMPSIIEGVECEEQWLRLQDLGCEYGQGFYLSRPMTGDAALALLGGEDPAGSGERGAGSDWKVGEAPGSCVRSPLSAPRSPH